MLHHNNKILFLISFVIVFFFLSIIPSYADGTHPQGIKLDGTIGTAGKIDLPGPNYEIKAEYGKQSGANLFHSFQQFNIHKNESATFSGPSSVKNIISRVTGGSASWIDGRLASTISGADMYFVNPAGIMFGANASLDLGGSFHVSTADYLKMGENERFYSKPMANEVLSVAAPSAFGFLNAPADIQFQGSHLKVLSEKEISVTSGNISMENSRLFASDGTIRIASVVSSGEVVHTDTGLEISDSETLGKISLVGFPKECTQPENMVALDVSGKHGGLIIIRGKDLFLSDVTGISAVSLETGTEKNSGIDIGLSGKLEGKGNSFISGSIIGAGHGASVRVTARQIELQEGSSISSAALGAGIGGNVDIKADDIVIAGISNNPRKLPLPGMVLLLSSISSISMGKDRISGQGGQINVEAGHLTIKDTGGISAVAISYGKGGAVNIRANRLEVIDGGNISSGSLGLGQGGSININADEVILSNVGLINSTSLGLNAGDAGNISITADCLTITGGGNINVSTSGFGMPGTIQMKISDTLYLSGIADERMSFVYDIINTQLVGAFKAAGVLKEDIIGHSGVLAAVVGAGPKSAGTINIEAGKIKIIDGAKISSENRGQGDAGVVSILSEKAIDIENASVSTAAKVGGGGGISIQTKDMLYSLNSQIETSVAGGDQNAGDIHIANPEFVILNHSTIQANAYEGDGGAVFVITENFLKSFSSIVEASSARGNNGTVKIEAPDLNLSGSLTILSGNFFDASRFAASSCEERSGETRSRFEVHRHLLRPEPFEEQP